jgi:hypothetical protein
MKAILGIVCGLLLVAGIGTPPSSAGQSNGARVVLVKSAIGGTVESVDPRNLLLTLKTDSGEMQSLTVAKQSVLRGVAPGDRISCEMKDGKVMKIVKATPTPKDAPPLQPTKGELGG